METSTPNVGNPVSGLEPCLRAAREIMAFIQEG